MKIFFYRTATTCWKTSMAAALLALACFAGVGRSLYGQAEPTATRFGDLKVGGTFNLADSDYTANRFRGFGFYSNFDVNYHLGLEAEFHQLNNSVSSPNIYERTYEVGPRYVLHYRRIQPFAKALYGRGVFNYPKVGPGFGANIAYNVAAVGGGADYILSRSLILRAGYEYQRWLGFPPHGLTPAILEVGVAYHFH